MEMITKDIQGRKVLEIFERFIISDDRLKKRETIVANRGNVFVENSGNVYTAMNSSNFGMGGVIGTNADTYMLSGNMSVQGGSDQIEPKKNLLQRILERIINNWYLKINVDTFFKCILSSQEAVEANTREEAYKKLINNAKDSGQTALVEKLTKEQFRNMFENQLFIKSFKKYISEEQLIEFVEKTKNNKTLYLTWIKNFARILPQNVLDKKKEFDKYELFDNYVVLHYDPTGTNEELTEMEKELKRDPILFGVNKCSRRLYFVADWKDDFCDLTFDQIAAKLEKTLELT